MRFLRTTLGRRACFCRVCHRRYWETAPPPFDLGLKARSPRPAAGAVGMEIARTSGFETAQLSPRSLTVTVAVDGLKECIARLLRR